VSLSKIRQQNKKPNKQGNFDKRYQSPRAGFPVIRETQPKERQNQPPGCKHNQRSKTNHAILFYAVGVL
jgi:hypothetical protein